MLLLTPLKKGMITPPFSPKLLGAIISTSFFICNSPSSLATDYVVGPGTPASQATSGGITLWGGNTLNVGIYSDVSDTGREGVMAYFGDVTIQNAGGISGGVFGINAYFANIVGDFSNSGVIQGGTYGMNTWNSRIDNLVNTNTIQGTNVGMYLDQATTIGSITNDTGGQIVGGGQGITFVSTTSPSGTLINNGSILGTADKGLYFSDFWGTSNFGTVLNNAGGTISGGNVGISLDPAATVTEITNYGTITGLLTSIYNLGTISSLNNAQPSLKIDGNLPATYRAILGNNASTYGSLIYLPASGALANFGIYGGSINSQRYIGVLTGITSISNGASGTYSGHTYRLELESGSTNVWDLVFSDWLQSVAGPDATNTLKSVQQNATGLSAMYNQQAAAYQAALSYDCQVYDANGMCVSVGGRYTYAGPSPSTNQQAGLVVLGYKPMQTLRFGAFADQSVNVTTPNGFKQNKNSPMWGVFAKWHMNKDETGLGVQASAVTSASSLNVTRTQLTNTEAGSGTTQFNGQGYQLTTNYHQPVTDSTAVVPYIGLRYTRINAGSYAENASATVTSPLSYNAMTQNTFSAIGGIGVRSHLAEKLTGSASVGIQQNLKYSMGNYAGTSSINALESFSVQMPGNVNSMATASAGMYYDIRKNERVSLNVLWQQQPFIATNTTTAIATYTIGF